MKKIPYGRQYITDEDIDSVVKVLKSDWLTQGPSVKEFEDAFSNYIGSRFAVAVSNGTAALHLSVLSLNIKHYINKESMSVHVFFKKYWFKIVQLGFKSTCGGENSSWRGLITPPPPPFKLNNNSYLAYIQKYFYTTLLFF